jgi:putative flippase GtrA
MAIRVALSPAPRLALRPFALADVLRLARAGLAGLFATLVDLGVLALLTSGFHVDPRIASLPALLAGGIANFVGNRHFAFRAQGGSFLRQALLYSAVEVLALVWNGVLFDLVLRSHPEAAHAYPLVRLATSHLVFLCWSYPLWNKVFVARKSPVMT